MSYDDDVEARRSSHGQGPSADQLEVLERLGSEHDVVLAEWLQGSGDVEASTLRAGRPSAVYRIYADGRCVEERTWS